MLTLVGGPAGMAIALAVLARPRAAAARARAAPPRRRPAERRRRSTARRSRARARRGPSRRYFRVGPRVVVAPALPKIALRIDEAGVEHRQRARRPAAR